MDASSVEFKLISVVSKTPVAAGTEFEMNLDGSIYFDNMEPEDMKALKPVDWTTTSSDSELKRLVT